MTDKVEKNDIEYFNEYMKTFVLEIKETFPEFNEIIGGYYTDLLIMKHATMTNMLSVLCES